MRQGHAVTVVWVAATFTDEHRATLGWLNEITDDRFRFFGLEIELWRIGNSPVAPKLNIVSKPNDWSRSVSQSAKRISDEPLNELQETQLRYWTKLKSTLNNKGSSILSRKPLPQPLTTYGIGRSGFQLAATINTLEHRLSVQSSMYDDDAKIYYQLLFQEKEEIEESIGAGLEWMELPEIKSSRIELSKQG